MYEPANEIRRCFYCAEPLDVSRKRYEARHNIRYHTFNFQVFVRCCWISIGGSTYYGFHRFWSDHDLVGLAARQIVTFLLVGIWLVGAASTRIADAVARRRDRKGNR